MSHQPVCPGLPVQLPRRASAYDVYSVRSGDPGSGGGLNPAAMAAAVANVSRQQQQQSQQNQQSQQSSGRCVLLIHVSLLFSLRSCNSLLCTSQQFRISCNNTLRTTLCVVPGMAVMETLWRLQMAPVLQVFPCLDDHLSGQSYRPHFTTPTHQISLVSDVTSAYKCSGLEV